MIIKNKKQKMLFDMFLNICATAVPIAILQLVVYPFLSKRISADNYGLMITMYSMWVVISNSFGNVLNNIRLLHANDYEEHKLEGDFSLLLRRWLIVNLIIIFFGSVFYIKEFRALDIIFSLLIATLILLKAYLEVGFRIKLNYKYILINGVLQSFGFLLGLSIFNLTHIWQFVFLCGFLLSTTFTITKTGILKEPFSKTIFFQDTKRDVNLYTIATFSASLMSYADKMVLYPLMGGHTVSIYYTATILGKIVNMVSGPITSVILSYISKWDKGKKTVFSKILFLGIIISIFGYVITIIVSNPLIKILFPQWAEEVLVYVPITTIAIVIQTLNSFLNPFVLKFYDIKWQIVINIVSVGVYFISALGLWSVWGMLGFCVGTVIGHLAKTTIMIYLHFSKSKNY